MTKSEAKDSKPSSAGAGEGVTSPAPIEFLKETKREFERVVWPTRQQLLGESAAVLLMVVAAATLIYLVDGLFGWLAQQVF